MFQQVCGVHYNQINCLLRWIILIGVEDGMTIRIPNAGDVAMAGKGPAGDLLVKVNVASSKTFRRKGANLYHEARIPLHTALLGGRVRVPTLEGEVDVRVPSGTQQGEEMVLKERGVNRLPGSGGDRGDQFVTFSVQLPRSVYLISSDKHLRINDCQSARFLTQRQREIIQQYADDVEGRATTKEGPQPANTDGPYSTSGSRPPSKPGSNDDNNGTTWVSRTWKKIRALIEF
jgi:molecular chaperone DnaJ